MPEVESLEEKDKILGYAYDLLKANGQPLHYSMLLEEIASRFFADRGDVLVAKARFYTWLNLDARFTSAGQGCWGLRTSVPQKGSRQVPLLSLMHKTVEYDDSPARVIVRGDLDEESLTGKDLLEDDRPEADNEDVDDFDEDNERPVK